MADEIEIEPKAPVNPAGKPGVGGLAAIPAAIGAIVGADGFCSIYNLPLAALCIDDPNTPDDPLTGSGAMPAWCLLNSDWSLCPGVETPVDPESGLPWGDNACFDVNWYKIPCSNQERDPMFGLYRNAEGVLEMVPIGNHIVCLDINNRAFYCDSIEFRSDAHPPRNFKFDHRGNCYYYETDLKKLRDPIPCRVNIDITALEPEETNVVYSIDRYMRIVDNRTFIPITNENYENGYPMIAVYPPPPPEPEPEPFDPGPNPFNPEKPVIPEGETADCGFLCDCMLLIVNALGAVNNTLIKIDDSVLSVVSAIENKVMDLPEAMEVTPFDDSPILEELEKILKAIDEISIEVTKEAGTNMWDFLGSAFGDIFEFVEFLIEKIIYLVIPEDTTFINESIANLNNALNAKIEPVNMLKDTVTVSMDVEEREFDDYSVTLPMFGTVEIFDFKFLNEALPKIRGLLEGIMILITAFWAFRKISSGMVK